MCETDRYLPICDSNNDGYITLEFPSGEVFKILCANSDKEHAYYEFIKLYDGSVIVSYDFNDIKKTLAGECFFFTEVFDADELNEGALIWTKNIIDRIDLKCESLFAYIDGAPSLTAFTLFSETVIDLVKSANVTYNGMSYENNANLIRVNIWII